MDLNENKPVDTPPPPANDEKPAPPPVDTPPPPANDEVKKSAPTPKAPGDIFDELKDEETKQTEVAEAAKAALAEYAKAAGFADGPKDLVLGQGDDAITIPADDVGTVVAALKGADVPAEQAKGVLATVVLLDKVRLDRQIAAENQVFAHLREEAEAEFGDNFLRVVGDAQAGAKALFGSEFWEEIKTIRALTNDKRFLRAMATYGKSLRGDTGGPPSAPGAVGGGKMKFDLNEFWKGTGAR